MGTIEGRPQTVAELVRSFMAYKEGKKPEVCRVRDQMNAVCNAILEGDLDGANGVLEEVDGWDVTFQRDTRMRFREGLGPGPYFWHVVFEEEEREEESHLETVQKIFIRLITESPYKAALDLTGIAEELGDMVSLGYLVDMACVVHGMDRDAVEDRIRKARDAGELKGWRMIRGILFVDKREGLNIVRPEEEGEGMVTIRQLVIESGQNEHTVRGRIYKARKYGKLKRWEKQGGTVLVDRTEGLEIASSVGEPMVKMGRPPKSH